MVPTARDVAMMTRVGIGGLSLLLSSGLVAVWLIFAGTALANDRQQGWAVQFFEEDGRVFTLAMLDAQGTSSQGGSLFLACGSDGPVVFYQDRFTINDSTLEMDIHSRDEVLSVTFQVEIVPFFGHRLRLEADASRAFLWAFTVMENAAVKYRIDSQDGYFPTIGTGRIVEIFESNCAV